MKRFISHLVTAAMLLATTLTTHAAEKPDIVHYTAQFLDRVLHVTLQWQSANPVTLVRVSAGQQAKEVKVDEYDNRRVPGGYTGEVTVNVPVDAALYQTAVPYVLQLQDELRLKSELVTGNAPMPAAAGYDGYDRGYGDHGGRRDDRWGQDALKDRPKSEGGSGSIIDKLAELKDKYDLAPSITEIKVNQVGPENVTFTLKANDDKQLREINFKVFDAAGNLAQTQQVTGLGRVWEGTSPVFKLSGGSYKVTAQAIDSAGNTSKEQTATFFVKGTAPEPPPKLPEPPPVHPTPPPPPEPPPPPVSPIPDQPKEPEPPRAGECGSAHGKSFDTRPTTDLCKQGTATDVLGDGPWTWSCKGLNGGDSSCKADKTTTPVPKTHEVKAVASQGGSVTPASQNIEHGTKAIVTVTSEEGFKIKSVTGCGGSSPEGNKYTTAPVTAPCEVKAEFEKQEFEVTTSSNCATITPASRKVLYGDTTTFKIVPNVGKKLSSVSGCNIVKMTEETYTTGTIAAACSVQAVCDAVLHEVKAVASQGGGATPPSQNIEHGTKAIVTVTSDKGFKIKSVTGCGEGRLEGDKYTTAPVIAPCEVKAEFEKQEFEVTTSSNCATITPASRKVLYGDTITFKIVPNAGKKLSSVSGCNIVKMTEETYTTGAITAACSVQAACDAVLHEVKAVASQGCSVMPASQNVEHGKMANITITSTGGYKPRTITGCDGVAKPLSGNSYTTEPVTSPCTLQIVCATTMYEVKAAAAPAQGGTVTPASQVTEEGKSATVTAKPNDGYTFDRWGGDCSSANSNLIATLVNVTSNKSCTANFSQIPKPVCGSSNGQSFLTSPTANLCQAGNSSSVSQTASDWTWNCTVSGANAVPCSAKRLFTLTTSVLPANENAGTVSAQPQQAGYPYNTSVTLTAVPSTGYQFSDWAGNCSGTGSTTSVSMTSNKSCAANLCDMNSITFQHRTPGGKAWTDHGFSVATGCSASSVVLEISAQGGTVTVPLSGSNSNKSWQKSTMIKASGERCATVVVTYPNGKTIRKSVTFSVSKSAHAITNSARDLGKQTVKTPWTHRVQMDTCSDQLLVNFADANTNYSTDFVSCDQRCESTDSRGCKVWKLSYTFQSKGLKTINVRPVSGHYGSCTSESQYDGNTIKHTLDVQ